MPATVKARGARQSFLKPTAPSLLDFHYVCPMPSAVLPSRLSAWLEENCELGWYIQFPRMGLPSFKNTVVVFQNFDDMNRYREHYCFKTVFHKRPHEADWSDAVLDNE